MPTKRIETWQNGEMVDVTTRPITPAEHNEPILAKLKDLDARSIRALREGNGTRLDELEAEAAALRATLLPEGA